MKTGMMKSKAGVLFAALLITLGGCAATGSQDSTGQLIDDSAITTKVKADFVADKTVSALDIGVETHRGIVQLSGFAKSKEEIRQAESIARQVGGVRGVRNDIVLR